LTRNDRGLGACAGRRTLKRNHQTLLPSRGLKVQAPRRESRQASKTGWCDAIRRISNEINKLAHFMLLMIDNYDSFTYNLVQYFGELGEEVRVFRNDEITVQGIGELKPSSLVLSPGPCSPNEAGVCVGAVRELAGRLPILGVCLGHQAIGAALGGRVVRARLQMHGKASLIRTDRAGVFSDLPGQFSVIRYHSLAIERETLPAELVVTATSDDDEIMGVRHRGLAGTDNPLEGVQFHPESILSEHGHAMLRNFLQRRH
jgi:anthranilate synthase component 2